MVFNQFLSFRHNVLGDARLTGQFNFRLQPKLGLPIRVRHMNMDPHLLAGEKKNRNGPSRKTVGVIGNRKFFFLRRPILHGWCDLTHVDTPCHRLPVN
jgi:hypothetical protein